MEIFKGLKYYDIGYFVYDLWIVIVVAFLCAIVVFIVNRSFSKLPSDQEAIYPKTLDYILPILMVIGLVSTTSDISRLMIVIIMLLIQFIIKGKKDAFVSILVCSLIGFGYNVLPLSITLVIFFVSVFINRKKQMT